MRRVAWLWAGVASTVLATGCGDGTTTPSESGVALGAASRIVSIRDDSLSPMRDSVAVVPSGPDAATMSWVATHGGGAWLTLLDSAGTGAGTLRWRRDPTALDLPSGTFVDTIRLAADNGRFTASLVDSLIVRESPAMFITVRRAWLPGERTATIAAILQYRTFGALSDLAQVLYGSSDSVMTVIRNPLYPAARATDLALAPAFNAAWNITGLDLHQVDNSHPPAAATDTLDWIEVFWYNPAEPTHKGFVVAHSVSPTISNQKLNTTAFDASGGTSGGGGGEARFSTGHYWEVNGGFISAISATYGSSSPIGSGQWTGGTYAVGTMTGKLRSISMPLVLPAPNPALDQSFSLDFTAAGIPALQVDCVFPSPCTGAAARAIAELMREARSAGTPGLAAVMGALGGRSANARTPRSIRTTPR